MTNTQTYTQALAGLLPPGAAWQGRNLQRLLSAWATGLVRSANSLQTLLGEANPANSSDLLPEWERLLGIVPLDSSSIQAERREVVLSRLASGVPTTDTALLALAGALGWRLAFTYFIPARVSKARLGTRGYGAPWVFAKRITGTPSPSEAVNAQTLRTILTTYQPAHEAWLWALA